MRRLLALIAAESRNPRDGPRSAFAHLGNGTNMVYVDPENDIVAVVRWIDNAAADGFVKRLIAAMAEKS